MKPGLCRYIKSNRNDLGKSAQSRGNHSSSSVFSPLAGFPFTVTSSVSKINVAPPEIFKQSIITSRQLYFLMSHLTK